jgi:glycosyltransferase involved in cell wall biosynthesis
MKGESLTYSLQAVRSLGRELPLRLLVVGDGTARERLAQLAAEVNAELGREAVTLTGAMRDPRAAYAAADIVLGMGSSALRALAYGKPLIVLGERGFAMGFTRETAAQFLHTGFYGTGHGVPGADLLAQAIRQWAGQPLQLQGLGEFSREFVVEHYALEVISRQLNDVCVAALARPKRVSRMVFDALRTTAIYLRERRFGRRASTSTAMSFRDDTPARLAGLPTESNG